MNKLASPTHPVSDAHFAGNTSYSIVLDQRPPKTEVDNDFKEDIKGDDSIREDWQAAGND